MNNAEQKVIETIKKMSFVRAIIKLSSPLQPDLYSKDFDLAYMLILSKVNQRNLDYLQQLKQSFFTKQKTKVALEVLSQYEIEVMLLGKHSFCQRY